MNLVALNANVTTLGENDMKKIIAAGMFTLFSGMVFAGTTLNDLDANKDGLISAEEAKAKPELAKGFSELDKNQDGQLDSAEFAQFEMEPVTEQLMQPEASTAKDK